MFEAFNSFVKGKYFLFLLTSSAIRCYFAEAAWECQDKNKSPKCNLYVETDSNKAEEPIIAFNHFVVELSSHLHPNHEADFNRVDDASANRVVVQHVLVLFRCLSENFRRNNLLHYQESQNSYHLLGEKEIILGVWILVPKYSDVKGHNAEEPNKLEAKPSFHLFL